MKSKQRRLFPIAASLAVLLTLPPAWAIKIVGEPPPDKATSASRPAFTQPQGTIERIDLGSNTMVVGGVAYLFSGASVVVHASDPMVNGNALKLRKGDRIRFAVRKEANATRERITEIWVLEDKAPAPKPK
jgi:hypothetical protein